MTCWAFRSQSPTIHIVHNNSDLTVFLASAAERRQEESHFHLDGIKITRNFVFRERIITHEERLICAEEGKGSDWWLWCNGALLVSVGDKSRKLGSLGDKYNNNNTLWMDPMRR